MADSEPWVGTWRPHKAKGPISAQFRSPGPIYELPPITGHVLHESTKKNAPSFTMGARLKEPSGPPAPEFTLPSAENEMRSHGITFGQRLPSPKSFQVPGPGTYHPELSKHVVFPTVCAFSLSGKIPEKLKDDTPGPATYNLFEKIYSTIPKAPACSFGERTKVGDFCGYPNPSPGPAAYKTVNYDTCRKKAPHFSLLGRNFIPLAKTETPGPAKYNLKEESHVTRRGPSYSFGVRHSEYVLPVLLNSDDD